MKKLILIISAFVAMAFPVLSVSLARAADCSTNYKDPLACVCGQTGAGDSSVCSSRSNNADPVTGTQGALTKAIEIVSFITGIAAVIIIIIGGLQYILSTGDSTKVNKAKETILYAVIGLVIAVLAQVIVRFIVKRL